MFILQNFNPLTRLGLVVSGVGDLSSFSLDSGSDLFSFSSSMSSLKTKSQKIQINVKKDCLWKQRTHYNSENGSLGFIETLISSNEFCLTAYAL